jgi:hypothetical protein
MADSRTARIKLDGESAELFCVEAGTGTGPLETVVQLEFPSLYVKGMDLDSDPAHSGVEPWVRIAFHDGSRTVRFQLDMIDALRLARMLGALRMESDEILMEDGEPGFMLATAEV